MAVGIGLKPPTLGVRVGVEVGFEVGQEYYYYFDKCL
jgi:hypothetical protein